MAILIFILMLLFSGIVHADDIMIQIKFSADTKYGKYADALYIPLEQYQTLKPEEIAKLKQDRIDTFVYNVENPPPPPVLTDEQLEQQKEELLKQIQQIDQEMATN